MRANALALATSTPAVRRRLRVGVLVSWLVIACWSLFLTAQAMGQGGYDALPINPEFDYQDRGDGSVDRRALADRRQKYVERSRLVSDILQGRASLGDNRAGFDQWFNDVVFAEMAQTDDQYLADLADNRESLFKSLNSATNAEAVRHVAVDLAFPKFRQIAEGNYHPAARLNAVIVMGRLDEVPGRKNANPPQPLAAALPVLLQYVQDGALPEYLRVGALVGIERHCFIDGQKASGRLAAAAQNQIVGALMGLIAAPPEGVSESIGYWMRRSAVRSLGRLRSVGNNNEVAAALMEMMKDVDSPIWIRCEAAVAYGRLDYADPNAAQPAETAKLIAQIAAQAAQNELATLDDEEKQVKEIARYKASSGGGGSMGFGGSGGFTGPGAPGAGGGAGPALPNAPGGAGGSAAPEGGGGSTAGKSAPGGGVAGGMGGYPGMGMGGYPGMGGAAAGTDLPVYRFRLSQRRLMSVVFYLQQAMQDGQTQVGGLRRIAANDPTVTEVATELDKLMTEAGVEYGESDDFVLVDALDAFRDGVAASARRLEEMGVSAEAASDSDPFDDNS